MVLIIQINIQYKKLDYCSKEWRKVLFDLPLEVAYLIYQMAIQKHMISWKNEHEYLMWNIPEKVVTITTDYSIEIEKLKKKYEIEKDYTLHISDIQKKKLYISCFGVIENLGIQNKYHLSINRDIEENCIKVPQKFTCKRCKPINVNNEKYLRCERVDMFIIDNIPDDIYEFLKNENRVVYEKGEPINKYWVENKCRCFTCDLVRYSYRNYTIKDYFLSNIWPKNKSIYARSNCGNWKFSRYEHITCYDWYKTYDNLIVDLEKKQWKRIY